jgi:hypothetical protein
VADRLRLGGPQGPVDHGLEPRLGCAVVPGHVRAAVPVPLAVPGDDDQLPWPGALEPRHLLGVGRELDQSRRLGPSRQLGVGHVVGPRTERRGGVGPHQEVGVAPPPAVEEGGLEDDVDPGPHEGEGPGLGRRQRLW